MIKLEHISKTFGDTGDGVHAVKDVSLEIGDGEIFGIIGFSGAGKSTLVRCINLLERPTSGSITVNGQKLTWMEKQADGKSCMRTVSPQELRQARKKISMIFQGFNLLMQRTCLKNICFPLELIGMDKEKAKKRALELLDVVGLPDKANAYPAQLSGGQQQRVALARMLAARPGILMLDEPFSALDSHLKGVLEQNLVSLFEAFEGTILYVSHDIDESLRFCDRIAVVDAGRIVEMDRGRELVNRPQSVAGLKLSGCKNAPAAEYAGPHAVHVPPWGIDVHTAQEVPRDVKCLGLRAFYVERAEGPGENCYRVRVDRVSDARFERMALLGFLDRDDADGAAVAFETNEMSYLHQHMFWRVSMREGVALPEVGERLWVRIPPDMVYLVSR